MARRVLAAAFAAALLAVLLFSVGVVRVPVWLGGEGRARVGGDGPAALDVPAPDGEDEPGPPGLAIGRGRPAKGDEGAAGAGGNAPKDADAPGPGLDGVVKRADGTPVAHAKVLLVDAGGTTFAAVTDADGKFHLDVAAGKYDLVIRAGMDGALLLRGFYVDGATNLKALTLSGSSEVRVEVAQGGQSARDAKVTARLRFDGTLETVAEGATDGGGVFIADGLPPGPYTIEVVPGEGIPTEAVTFSKNVELSGPQTVTFALPGFSRLSGAVLDADTRAPVEADIVLGLVASDGLAVRVEAKSRSDGLYVADVPQARIQSLLVSNAEYAPYPAGSEAGKAFQALRPLAQGQAVALDVPLHRGIVVKGVVTLAGTKQPVPNLRLQFAGREALPRTATTRDDGTYEAHGLAGGTYRALVETPGWYPKAGTDVVRVPAPSSDPPVSVAFDLEVWSAGAVSGVVVDASEAPVVQARVWLAGGGGVVRGARRAGRELETYTDGSGSFSIDDVPPDVWIRVRAALGDAEALPSNAYRLADGPVPPIRLVLRATGRIVGKVSDLATREPLAGVQLRVDPVGEPAGRTGRALPSGPDGRFEVAGLIPGTWAVLPRKRDYLPAKATEVAVVADTAGAVPPETPLALDPGLSIGGVVVDSEGRAVPSARLQVAGTEDVGSPPPPVSRWGAADANGLFRLTGFRSGLYVLTVRRGGYAPAKFERLRGGEERLRIVLEPPPR